MIKLENYSYDLSIENATLEELMIYIEPFKIPRYWLKLNMKKMIHFKDIEITIIYENIKYIIPIAFGNYDGMYYTGLVGKMDWYQKVSYEYLGNTIRSAIKTLNMIQDLNQVPNIVGEFYRTQLSKGECLESLMLGLGENVFTFIDLDNTLKIVDLSKKTTIIETNITDKTIEYTTRQDSNLVVYSVANGLYQGFWGSYNMLHNSEQYCRNYLLNKKNLDSSNIIVSGKVMGIDTLKIGDCMKNTFTSKNVDMFRIISKKIVINSTIMSEVLLGGQYE